MKHILFLWSNMLKKYSLQAESLLLDVIYRTRRFPPSSASTGDTAQAAASALGRTR